MTDLVEKLYEVGIRLPNYYAGDRKILCPKCSHQRRNKADTCLSVHIDDDEQNACWMCHHCDWRGSTINDDPRAGGRSQRQPERPQRQQTQAPPRLQPPPRLEAPPEQPKPSEEAAVYQWFLQRGIPPEVWRRAQIKPTNHYLSQANGKTPCIAFPYFRDGKVVNVKYRALAAKHFAQAKGGMQVFYGLDDLEQNEEVIREERIVIVEGEIDKLTLDTCGIANVLSVPDGAPAQLRETVSEHDAKFAFLHHDADRIDKFAKFVIAVDNDGPGNVLAEELARRLGKERCYRVRWPDQGDALCKDSNETLLAHGPEVVRECIEAAEPYPIQGYHPWDNNVLRDRKTLGIERGIGTGWAALDEHMTIAPGQLSVVTGIPNHGKSEFIDALVVNLAMRQNWKFALCSFENSIVEHEAKIAEKYLGIPFWDSHSHQGMTLDDIDRASEWAEKHFWFLRAEDESPTIDWLLEKARVAVLRDGVHGLVIDPYNEIEHSRPSNMTETEYVSQILGRVKRFAQNHAIHVWFVAHPVKLPRDNGKIPMPTLYDISGSAHWANKADIGVVVHRDFDNDHTEICVSKVRHKWIGRPGKVTLRYDRVTGRYSEPAAPSHWSDR